MKVLLHITNLHVAVEKKALLHGINMVIEPGAIHALLGPNGSGKSTFAYVLAGHPQYTITNGTITLNGCNITNYKPDERARQGLFVAFQQLSAISGLTVYSFLKESYRALGNSCRNSHDFRKLLEQKMILLNLDVAFLERSLYEGFSGGERKRIELLQLLLFKPKVAILDEIDSGVDVDSRKILIKGLQEARNCNRDMSIIFITHYQHILQYLKPDYVHILKEGKIIQSGTSILGKHIEQHGYHVL